MTDTAPHAAVAYYGSGPVCYGYGDTLAKCKADAKRRLHTRRDEYGRGLYRHIHWVPLTVEDASECSSMLDAPLDAPERAVHAAEAPAAVTHAPPGVIPPGARLSAALRAIRWTAGVLAVELGLSPSTTRNWTLGRQPLPEAILAWVEGLASHRLANPPPPVPDGRVPRAG